MNKTINLLLTSVLSCILIISCTKNKDKENYYNLQLNFKQDTEKNYTSNIELYITSIELYNLTAYTKKIITQYTKKKEIKSITAKIKIKYSSHIEKIDKLGNATINHKTNKILLTNFQINKEKLNINYPYPLPINKNNTVKKYINPKGKIISIKNTTETKQEYYNIIEIINKTFTLPDKIQIGKTWISNLKDTYSFKKGTNKSRFKLKIINKITLNNLNNNILDISSKLSANVKMLIILDSIKINAEMLMNTRKNTLIDNNNGLEKQGHSKSYISLEGNILPNNSFSNRYKENFGNPKFKIKGNLNYTNSQQ